MTVDFGKPLLDLDGASIVWDAKSQELCTLGSVSVAALARAVPGDEKLTGEPKFILWELATRVKRAGNGECEVSVEEVALIKDRIGRMFSAMVVGPAWNALEGK